MHIIADRREKNSLVIAELVEQGVHVDLRTIEVADYVIGEEVAIERKTVNDFISSMFNKRLLKQLHDLKDNYKKPILLIEGIEEQDLYTNKRFKKLHGNAVRGMILSVILEYGVPILFTKDYVDTAKFITLLAKREGKPSRELSLKAKRKVFSLGEQQQFILEGFPGIGPKIARELLQKFKTIKDVINAEESELNKIKKFNSKKVEAMKRILGTEYKP